MSTVLNHNKLYVFIWSSPSTFDVYPARKLAFRIMDLIDMGVSKKRATEIADVKSKSKLNKCVEFCFILIILINLCAH